MSIMFAALLKYGLQPLILLGALGLWLTDPDNLGIIFVLFMGALILISVLEYVIPARSEWRIPPGRKLAQFGVWASLLILSGFVLDVYTGVVAAPLSGFRESFGFDIWPHHWPIFAQALMIFLASEFIWYWLHRAEHRWDAAWRITGHGAHHAYKELNALNSGLNHPFELVFLVAPTVTIELLFGVGTPALGALLLLSLQTLFAHANLDLNTSVIGWVFTTNRYHIHHHSVVREESNTNFGCAAIVWDRLFGTFSDASTEETGTGPTEPGLWQKAYMPFSQPADTSISP